MQRLEQSLVTRAMNVFRARDGVERETLRTRQDNATVDEVEYHLHAAVSALAAACDSVALLCCMALGVPETELAREQASMRSKEWRKAITKHGGQSTRKVVSAHAPVLAVVKSFRDPIIHQSGVSGTVVHHVDEHFSAMAIDGLSDDQTHALEALGTESGSAKRWGLRRSGTRASLAPLAFATSLAHEGMKVVDDVLGALASDLSCPSSKSSARLLCLRRRFRASDCSPGSNPQSRRRVAHLPAALGASAFTSRMLPSSAMPV